MPAAFEIVETMFGDNFSKQLQSMPFSNDTFQGWQSFGHYDKIHGKNHHFYHSVQNYFFFSIKLYLIKGMQKQQLMENLMKMDLGSRFHCNAYTKFFFFLHSKILFFTYLAIFLFSTRFIYKFSILDKLSKENRTLDLHMDRLMHGNIW